MAMSLSSTYTGRVVSVNDKGLKLEGQDDWFNCSKFAPSIILPARGDIVTVSVDSKGFLRSCEQAEGIAANGSAAPSPSPAAPSTAKDRTITRLAVLKAAAEYAASKPQSSSGDVLKIAASWERWVLRSDDPADDNADAF